MKHGVDYMRADNMTRNEIYDFVYDTYCEWKDRDFHTFTVIIEKELGVTSDDVYFFYERYAENDFDEFILQIVSRCVIQLWNVLLED